MISPPVNATAVAPRPTSEVPPVNGAASIEAIPMPIAPAFTLFLAFILLLLQEFKAMDFL